MSNHERGNQASARPPFGAKRSAQQGGDNGPTDQIAEAMRRTEEELQQVDQSPPLTTLDQPISQDPNLGSPSAIAQERAQQILTNISSQTLGELRALREQ